MSNRIELEGRVVGQLELRVTPAGTPLLRLRIDCGDQPGELVMAVLMAGREARILAAQLKANSMVRLAGVLRVQKESPVRSPNGPALVIMAHEIRLIEAR